MKDVLCQWVRILQPLSFVIVFSMILLIIIASFISSLVSRGDLVLPGAAVLGVRSAPLVALPADEG
jgi:hypothetical protein